MKWLIVTGDDFGASDGINRGILEAHRNGILTSASLLVNRPASAEAAAAARECADLSLGLHLELDADHPERVPGEWKAQLGRFLELAGATPTHVDSHHDAHRDPRVLPQVFARARRAALPLRGHSRVRHLSRFYGRWGGRSHAEAIGVAGLVRLLQAEVGEGVTELSCHPGYVDPEFRSTYSAEREIEVRTLCNRQVRQAILDRGITLIGFRDLRGLTAPAAAPEAVT